MELSLTDPPGSETETAAPIVPHAEFPTQAEVAPGQRITRHHPEAGPRSREAMQRAGMGTGQGHGSEHEAIGFR
jgi:hypothetical protein